MNHLDLERVERFLEIVKFRARYAIVPTDETKIAALYSEFAEEDRELAEEGIDEYAELLRQEDLK